MSGSADFFLKDAVPEAAVIRFLRRLIPQGVESLDFPDHGAGVFVLYHAYSEGFRQCACLAWRASDFQLDDAALAAGLAGALATQVLFQPQSLRLPDDMDWCLVDCSGGFHRVRVMELGDGVTLSNAGSG